MPAFIIELCDIEWDTPIGEAELCGGDAMIRAVALEDVGGYDASLIAGEEPDLCFRLRRCGWKIYRIAEEMTVHDAAMTRFSQWWLRNQRGGYASAEAYWRHGGRRELRKLISNAVWSMPLAWPMTPLLWCRIYAHRRHAVYATFIVLGKLPNLHGQLKFFIDVLRGEAARLIEYK